jgi:putative multiple sugar transport system substrate-binding protein
MKKFLVVVMVLMMSVLSLSACTPKVTVKVGIILPTKDEPRWVQDETRFKAALEDADTSVEILFSQGSTATELANVEALLAKGIEVLIICAPDGAAAAAAVEKAKAEGVTVIAYDRLITGTDAVDHYVTFDSISVGTAQGQYLVDNATGTANPLYLYAGAATDNNAFLFFQGAWEVLQPKIVDGTFVIANSSKAIEYKDIKALTRTQMGEIIGQVTTLWDFNTALNLAQTHLTAASAELKGNAFILAPNDGTARAIADAFRADAAITSYFVTGQDAEVASVQYILDGKQSMTVFKDVRTLVSDAIAMALDVLADKTPTTTGAYDNGVKDVPSKQTAVVVVTDANAKAALVDSGYYTASQFTNLD